MMRRLGRWSVATTAQSVAWDSRTASGPYPSLPVQLATVPLRSLVQIVFAVRRGADDVLLSSILSSGYITTLALPSPESTSARGAVRGRTMGLLRVDLRPRHRNTLATPYTRHNHPPVRQILTGQDTPGHRCTTRSQHNRCESGQVFCISTGAVIRDLSRAGLWLSFIDLNGAQLSHEMRKMIPSHISAPPPGRRTRRDQCVQRMRVRAPGMGPILHICTSRHSVPRN
ncbi:hypothetical protein J6590_022599 [Homalodisca vitripennis]|nr:hypothetical protein J6590_022599 [Homalodisca vitripennis]